MSAPAPKLTRKKKLIFLAIYVGFLLLVTLVLCEIVVRARGFRPFSVQPVNIQVEPGGRLFQLDPTLGYTHLPGTFKVTLPHDYTFTITDWTNSLRITHPLNTYPPDPKKKQIWIMGCSFTQGWSLNNEDTYPWLVQKALPDYEVSNWGVNGYGTVHSLIQLKEMLAKGAKPSVIVVAYAEFHDERNTLLRLRRKAVVPYNRLGPIAQPYARLDSAGKLVIYQAPVEYTEFPLMRYLAFSHFLEQKYDALEDHWVHSHKVSEALMLEFASVCQANGIKLVVAGITADTQPMLDFCQQHNIATVNISVHLSEPGNRNLPYDDHPSAKANRIYAEKLTTYLRDNIQNPPKK